MSNYVVLHVFSEGEILTAADLNGVASNDIINGPINHASQHAASAVDDIKAYYLSLSAGGTVAAAVTFSAAAPITLTSRLNEYKGSDIASAATTDIGAAGGNFVDVTGTATITALGTIQAGTERIVRFTSTPTLTHNGTSLILPGGANIVCQANDIAMFRSLGAGNWVCTSYQRAVNPPYVQAATPAANTVPVRKTASPYVLDAAELAMTGEASATGGSSVLTLDLGTVKNGDRILINAFGGILWSGTATMTKGTIQKSTGTATIIFGSNLTSVFYALNYMTTVGADGSTMIILQVTGDGTLTISNTLSQTGGTSPTYTNQLYAFFLKKQ